MADVELDAPGLDLDAFRSLESNDFQAGEAGQRRKADFQGKACYWNNHPNSPNMNLVRMFSLKPGACHHLPVVTGKVELRPVPGRKRPHEDVEVVEVWMVAFFKGAVES